MNAKKIKDVMISYIKATSGEVRIYQEKSIGSSICDVMAVTDHLIGYEIKSDLDNYVRLREQVKAYTDFFDENYLVVGERHVNSAAEKIPLGTKPAASITSFPNINALISPDSFPSLS